MENKNQESNQSVQKQKQSKKKSKMNPNVESFNGPLQPTKNDQTQNDHVEKQQVQKPQQEQKVKKQLQLNNEEYNPIQKVDKSDDVEQQEQKKIQQEQKEKKKLKLPNQELNFQKNEESNLNQKNQQFQENLNNGTCEQINNEELQKQYQSDQIVQQQQFQDALYNGICDKIDDDEDEMYELFHEEFKDCECCHGHIQYCQGEICQQFEVCYCYMESQQRDSEDEYGIEDYE